MEVSTWIFLIVIVYAVKPIFHQERIPKTRKKNTKKMNPNANIIYRLRLALGWLGLTLGLRGILDTNIYMYR